MYKRGGKTFYSADIDENVWKYAQNMIEIWNPHDALDIAVLEDHSFRIVELNTLNSAGMYHINVGKLIDALMEFSI